jgi:transcriptional regulator with XRE-family HTH domain
VSTSRVASLGDYLRDQRRSAELSLRELAREAGVSNPYLSQVERGLRKPSAEVLHKIAGALQISAEHLFVQAGLLDESVENPATTTAVINADPALTPRQRKALLDIYAAFVAQNQQAGGPDPAPVSAPAGATADPESTPVPVGHANTKE